MKKKQPTLQTLKNPSWPIVVAAGLLLVLGRLVLAGAQNVYLTPNAAVWDDMVMYDSAVSIANGDWLGAYGPKTLAKYSFFSLWLAGLHKLGIPFLLGGQLLWTAAALAAAAAVAPLFKNRITKLFVFLVLLYNPAAVANPVPNAFVTRVYRDNIFPALCLLCIAGIVGFALRHAQPLRRNVWWLVLCGSAFAAAWLCREDGWWLVFFVAAASAVTAVFVLRTQGVPLRARLVRWAALVLVWAILAVGVLAWCAKNRAVYGRFVISDFTTGEFADAYGAMTRIEHQSWDPKVAVPRDVRRLLYEEVPSFAPLEALLESPWYLARYAGLGPNDDYTSGGFYWALREAAAELGHYDTPAAAKAYFETLAKEINALCDSGAVAAGPARSSVNPPIRAEYILPVLREGLYSVWFCASFQQCASASLFSPDGNNPEYYAEALQPMEEFLHEKALTAAQQNSAEPYYNLYQRVSFGVLDAIRLVYSIGTPVLFLLALCWLCLEGVHLIKRMRAKQRDSGQTLCWLLCLGLLLCLLLRCAMIAFVTVSSFQIGTYVMYLATVHPLLLLFGLTGTAGLWRLWRARAAVGKGGV